MPAVIAHAQLLVTIDGGGGGVMVAAAFTEHDPIARVMLTGRHCHTSLPNRAHLPYVLMHCVLCRLGLKRAASHSTY